MIYRCRFVFDYTHFEFGCSLVKIKEFTMALILLNCHFVTFLSLYFCVFGVYGQRPLVASPFFQMHNMLTEVFRQKTKISK